MDRKSSENHREINRRIELNNNSHEVEQQKLMNSNLFTNFDPETMFDNLLSVFLF